MKVFDTFFVHMAITVDEVDDAKHRKIQKVIIF